MASYRLVVQVVPDRIATGTETVSEWPGYCQMTRRHYPAGVRLIWNQTYWALVDPEDGTPRAKSKKCEFCNEDRLYKNCKISGDFFVSADTCRCDRCVNKQIRRRKRHI